MWERGRNMRQCVKCRFNRFHVLMLIHQWHNFVAWMCSVNVCVVRVSVSVHELNFLCAGLLPGWCWLDAFLFPSLPLPLFCSLSLPFSFSSLDSSSIHSSFPRIPWQRSSKWLTARLAIKRNQMSQSCSHSPDLIASFTHMLRRDSVWLTHLVKAQ